MIRKLLMVAAAAAVPIGAIAAGAVGGGVAGAKTLVPLSTVTCAMSGTVTFSPPGISLNGVTTTVKTSATNSTVSFSSCGAGNSISSSSPSLVITTKNSKCVPPFPANPTPVGTSATTSCAKKLLITDSGGALGTAGTFKSLEKAVKKLPLSLSEPTGSATLKTKATSAAEVLPGGACGASEVGFSIPLAIKTAPKSTLGGTGSILVCLGQDSNSKNFFSDLTSGGTIGSTQIDPATSSITVG